MNFIKDFIMRLLGGGVALVTSFFGGWFAKEKADEKATLKVEQKRDKIDAAAAPSPTDILERMRDGKF